MTFLAINLNVLKLKYAGTVNILGLQLQLTVEPVLGQLKVRICTG